MRPNFCTPLIASLALLGSSAFAADGDLPQRSRGDTPEAAAPLFQVEPGDPLLPDVKLSDEAFLTESEPVLDVARAQADYDRAQRKERSWQKLFKAGVLAQVEVESAALTSAKARAKLEKARVAQQQHDLEDLRKRAAAGQLTADAVAVAEAALQSAQTVSSEADAALQNTQTLIAEANVSRQRKLLAMGAGSKTQLQRAENTLAKLKPADH